MRRRGDQQRVQRHRRSTCARRSTTACASPARWAAALLDNRHAELTNVELAGAQPGVPDGRARCLGGYISLSALGVAPVAIGDEQILNFNAPAFEFAGQEWTRIGIDSNGYLIVGGGSSEDNNCCNLPAGPDPARPNNILAPFWTDLDGTGAPGIFAATVSGGGELLDRHRVSGATCSGRPASGRSRRGSGSTVSRTSATPTPHLRAIPPGWTSSSGPRTCSARATWSPFCPPPTCG